jgi:hypothetical protein
MARKTRREVVDALMSRYGRSFSDELGIARRNTPAPLYQTLCFALLASARIGMDLALRGTRALFDAGWTTPEKLGGSTWEARTRALNESGYARYDEKTSRMLGEAAELLNDRYHGDLRELREEAERDPDTERELLKAFKGVGDVGVDIFFRETQDLWDELYPFADDRVLDAADRLGLGDSAASLARLVSREDLPRLEASLLRCRRDEAFEEVVGG